eukprot:Rhum_TRINITY_DN14138_c0_g2::Rhum_TRINITY_DN14138_c0_g2_i2::g.70146::m.70146
MQGRICVVRRRSHPRRCGPAPRPLRGTRVRLRSRVYGSVGRARRRRRPHLDARVLLRRHRRARNLRDAGKGVLRVGVGLRPGKRLYVLRRLAGGSRLPQLLRAQARLELRLPLVQPAPLLLLQLLALLRRARVALRPVGTLGLDALQARLRLPQRGVLLPLLGLQVLPRLVGTPLCGLGGLVGGVLRLEHAAHVGVQVVVLLRQLAQLRVHGTQRLDHLGAPRGQLGPEACGVGHKLVFLLTQRPALLEHVAGVFLGGARTLAARVPRRRLRGFVQGAQLRRESVELRGVLLHGPLQPLKRVAAVVLLRPLLRLRALALARLRVLRTQRRGPAVHLHVVLLRRLVGVSVAAAVVVARARCTLLVGVHVQLLRLLPRLLRRFPRVVRLLAQRLQPLLRVNHRLLRLLCLLLQTRGCGGRVLRRRVVVVAAAAGVARVVVVVVVVLAAVAQRARRFLRLLARRGRALPRVARLLAQRL